jgi:hypothetical protein
MSENYTDPDLLRDLADMANSANIRVGHMATILSAFLYRRAKDRGAVGSAVLRGLANEIEEAAP